MLTHNIMKCDYSVQTRLIEAIHSIISVYFTAMRKTASLSWKFLCYADEEAFRLQSKHSDALYDYQMSMTFGLIWLAKKIIEVNSFFC